MECGTKKVQLIANRVAGAREGEEVYDRLSTLANRFLGVGVEYLGYVNNDAAIARATRERVPVVVGYPSSLASQRLQSIASKILALPAGASQSAGISLFWKRLVGWKEAS